MRTVGSLKGMTGKVMTAEELDKKLDRDERRARIKAELAKTPEEKAEHEKKVMSIRKLRKCIDRFGTARMEIR